MLTVEQRIRLFNGNGNWETYTANNQIPRFIMSDGPHGLRKQADEDYKDMTKSKTATCFPTASCIACSWDPELLYQLGQSIGLEAKAENVNLILGPGMNIKRSPLCGRNFEYFSEDPLLTALLAESYVNGMQDQGVGACLKHFACNNQETHRQTSSSNLSEYTLRKIYLSAFEYVIKKAKPAAVMCSYNKINGTYTCHNRHLLTEILREEWNYKGIVISDWGACINAPECLKAGMDLAMPDSHGYFTKQLQTAYNNGEINLEDLEKANSRLIDTINKFQIADSPKIDMRQQHNIAIHLAENSAVLLKNDGILPLTQKGKVRVIGKLAKDMVFQGGGSSHINTAKFPNAVDALTAAGYEIEYIENIKQIKSKDEIPTLLFIGLTNKYEGEGFDRTDLNLPEDQIQLVNKTLDFYSNTIVISFSGAPIDLTLSKNAKAILHMYLCGEGCGEAVARLIEGITNPSGKLAETWPLKIEDTPSYNNFALETDDIYYKENDLIGYRWYNQKNIKVQYPFGYGLSYTTFEVRKKDIDSKIEIQKNRIDIAEEISNIKIVVKNTGNYAGAEVLQCFKNGELCGFKKVYLEPNEEKEVEINIINLYKMYKNLDTLIPSISLSPNKVYTSSDSLSRLANSSLTARLFLKIMRLALRLMNPKLKPDDPALKIQIAAISENPLESLISTSGGAISEKMVSFLVKCANHNKEY